MEILYKQADLHEEYCKFYGKCLKKLMRLTNKAIIERTKNEFETLANEYIERFKSIDANPHYAERILEDLKTIKSRF